MIPRRRFDIGWLDVLYGIGCCFRPECSDSIGQRIERAWSSPDRTMVCLSVRSGFDAVLDVLDFPPQSEILVSALTIRDMVRIIERHGLVAVPVDLDIPSLAVRSDRLARAVTPRTRAVLVAHLFGSRMPMEPILQIAGQHGLVVFEDCAQAFCGDGYRGHPSSDVSLFSFGPIKTATALGGAILQFRDAALCRRTRRRQSEWPRLGRGWCLARFGKYAFLKFLSSRPVFSLFVAACRRFGLDHDRIARGSVRGFGDGQLFEKIRRRPSSAHLALLERRLRRFRPEGVQRRVALAELAVALLDGLERPGASAPHHTHWVFPVMHRDADGLVRYLWSRGFDATRGASSLCVVPSPADRPETSPVEAQRAFEQMLFLPVYEGLSRRDVRRLSRAVARASSP